VESAFDDGKLYGCGGADDGYAVFASLTAIAALQAQGVAHARCAGMIETCEESGSYDLPAYLDHLAPRLGRVDFVVGLDSGCGDYERLWATTSLRGIAAGTLTVEVLTEGVHSGDASGVVPSSFRIARHVLARLEDSGTGRIMPDEFHAPVPRSARRKRAAADIMGETVIRKYPFAGGTKPMVAGRAEAVLNRTWRPRYRWSAPTACRRSRTPATCCGRALAQAVAADPADARWRTRDERFEAPARSRPPHGATVRFEPDQGATGWNAPPTAPWLASALETASKAHYAQPAAAMGEGGTIPFMAMLGKHFPDAQFLTTGVLGPHSNAHGPNEFLHVPYAKKLTACVADTIAAHAMR
jgi:acetylornithine deacetylase/succinyl-diaminopimelate desuccinylase-like protein